MRRQIETNPVRFDGVLLTACALLLSLSLALGQGELAFGNVNPVYDVDGKTPLGPGFFAELYAAPVGSTSLAPVGLPVGFIDGGGFFNDNEVRLIPGVLPGQQAVVQVRAWRGSDGFSFEVADHPGGHVGVSEMLTLFLGGAPPNPPTFLFGLKSFSLYVVVP